MAFDVEGAKQAGYSDAEIANHLATTTNFDAEGARKAGYSDQEILAQLAKAPQKTGLEGYPEEGFQADYAQHPLALPKTGYADYREPGTDLTDIAPRDGAVTRIVGAADEGFRRGAAAGTDIQGQPLLTGLMRQGGGLLGAAGGALGQGAYELGNLWSPEAGRDAVMGAQVLGALWPLRAQIPSPAVLAAAPRVSPMMEAFDRAEAARAEQPSRPAPPDPAASGIARVQSQIGVRDAPPPSPDMTATPADRAPGFVPRVNVDPLTGEAVTTQVPTDLRLRAAIEAVPPEAPPGFVPPGERGPSVPPGAAGPATIPPYASPAPVAPPPIPAEPPGPRSVGAAASRDMTDPAYLAAKTPAQALNDFRTSVTQTVRDRAQPGAKEGTVEDHTVYVPGVSRLESARIFDPDIAGNHDVMKDIDKTYETAANAHEQRNHDILKETYLQQAGNTNSVDALKQARREVSPDALGVFQNERPVSAQPVVNAIDAILDGPNGKVDAVANTLNRIKRNLYDKDGNLEVLPSRLYGSRKNLTTIRDSKALTQEASDAATARHELGEVLPVLDSVIGSGSTGYSDVYLPQWAHYSRLIDQQEYLQSKTLGAGKVTGPDGNLTANGIQKLLEQIAIDKGKAGNSRAKTLTEDQLNNLVSIRNELAAMQYRDRLAASHGSPTVKKAAAAARLGISVGGMSPEAIDAAIHAVLAKTTLGAGNAIYQFGVKPILEKRREGKANAIVESTRNQLLRTDIPME